MKAFNPHSPAAVAHRSELTGMPVGTLLAWEKRNGCGPSDVNGTTLCSDSVVPGPGVRIPTKSNRDLTGRHIVKKNCVVSWHGFRGRITRVRLGYCYPENGSPLFINVGAWVSCKSVQVVG